MIQDYLQKDPDWLRMRARRSHDAQRKNIRMREEILEMLAMPSYLRKGMRVQTSIIATACIQAEKGDAKAREWLRDTAGQKPSDNINLGITEDVRVVFFGDDDKGSITIDAEATAQTDAPAQVPLPDSQGTPTASQEQGTDTTGQDDRELVMAEVRAERAQDREERKA